MVFTPAVDEKNDLSSVSPPPGRQAQQRELTLRHVKNTEGELNRNFHLQKEQYEATIQRHLAFIDQVGTKSNPSCIERLALVLHHLGIYIVSFFSS